MPRTLEFIEATPEAVPRLDGDSIHLWRIPYALSQGRAPLRALLASYLDVPVSAVALDDDAKGKPRLKPVPAGFPAGPSVPIAFNWSHSGDYALIALARDGALGVDIERLGKNLRALEIAQRFFDPAEAEALAALDDAARERAFIGLWCAKEAVLKAVGEGLSFGLARLAFAPRNDLDWALQRVDPALGRAEHWQLAGFDAAPGYRGSLAWQGDMREIRAFRLP